MAWSQQQEHRFSFYFCRVAVLALLAISLFYFEQMLEADLFRLSSHFIISGVEPQPVFGAMRVAAGKPLYDDYLNHTPHVPLAYGVLTYWVTGMIAQISGITGALDILLLGRLLAFISMAGVFTAIALLAQRKGRHGWFALAAPLALVWFPYIMEFGARFSPDAPAVLCSLAGWLLARHGVDKHSPSRDVRISWLIAGGFIWSLGFFLKPIIVAGQIAFLVEFLTSRHTPRQRLLTLSASLGTYIVVSLVSACILNAATEGLWRLNQIDAMTVCQTSFDFTRETLLNLRARGLLVLTAMMLLAAFHVRGEPLFIAFFLSFTLDLLLMSKQGSNVNYLLGSLAIWAVAASGILHPAWNGSKPFSHGIWAAIITLFLLSGASRANLIAREIRFPSIHEIQNIDIATRRLPRDQILAMDSFYGMMRGWPILYADSYHAALLSSAGRIDFSGEAKRIRSRQFAAIVANRWFTSNVRWHRAPFAVQQLRDAVQAEYRPVLAGDWLVLWVRKPNASSN